MRQLGKENLQGRNRRRKGAYIMHKAPYWRKTLKVLMSHLRTEKGFDTYEAAQATYTFVHLIFPDIIPRMNSARARWEFVRQRVRYSPKDAAL
jgi:hypothetical protein